jgi:hypothetical protein
MISGQNSKNLIKHSFFVDIQDVGADRDDGVFIVLERRVADDQNTSLNAVCWSMINGERTRQVTKW